MDFSQLNFLAILIAALSTFFVGGLWYSPLLFAKPWMKENKLSDEDLKEGNYFKIYGVTFLLALVIAINLSMFYGTEIDGAMGAFYGFLTGFGWVSMSVATTYLFERKSLKLILINCGYHVVTYTIVGFIVGVWH